MKQLESYTGGFAHIEQFHQELQLDAMRQLYRRRLLELNELKSSRREEEKSLSTLRNAVEEKQGLVDALQQHLIRMSQIIQSAETRVSYEKDYMQRQQYYNNDSQYVDPKIAIPKSLRDYWRNYKGVVVSPAGLRFQSERQKVMMENLANAGFLCLSFNEEIEGYIKRIEGNYYYFKNEVLLLTWLKSKSISPIVLCTWVLQSAWFDLLEQKVIWYDICDHEDLLWGMDAQSRLKHYDLLKQATLVTYSDKKWKRNVAPRNDAVLLIPTQMESIVPRFELFGGGTQSC